MYKLSRALRIMLMSLSALGLWQCVPAALVVGAGAGAGTYAYVEGESQAVYPYPFDRMWTETLNLFRQQQIGVITQYRAEGEGTIKGRRADGDNVIAKLVVQGTENTQVSLRVGLVPDRVAAENLQRQLAGQIQVQLPL